MFKQHHQSQHQENVFCSEIFSKYYSMIRRIYLKIFMIGIFHPGHSCIMYIIIPGNVPVVRCYLHVHFLVWIERKWGEIHQLTAGLSPIHVLGQRNATSLDWKTLTKKV